MKTSQTQQTKVVEVLRKRSSGVRKGNLVTPTEPMFITLTGLPANRSPFRVIRSDDLAKDDEGKTTWHGKEVQRMDSLTGIMIDGSMSDEDVAALMRDFGIDDSVFERIDGENSVSFQRRDDSMFADMERKEITLRAGVVVEVAVRSDSAKEPAKEPAKETTEETEVKAETETKEETEVQPEVQPETRTDDRKSVIARIRFDATRYTRDEVATHIAAMGIVADDCNITASGYSILVTRKDVDNTTLEIDFATPIGGGAVLEYREGEVDSSLVPGVAINYRSDTLALGAGNVENFGMWGWYQNTFDAAMADAEYSQKASKGIETLNDVLYDLLFWQREYTLAEVQKFVEYSFDQAKSYFMNLLASLNSGSQQRNDRGNTMALTKEDQGEIAKIVAAQLATIEEQRRNDAAKAEAEAAATKEKADFAAALTSITQRMDEMGKSIEALTNGNTATTDGKTEGKEETVVTQRSDGAETADDIATDEQDDKSKQKRSDNVSPFAGCFGDIL